MDLQKHLKEDWLAILLLVSPFVMILACLPYIEYPYPAHFGPDGQPDRYSDSPAELFMLPVVNLFVYLLLTFLPSLDPKKENYEQNKPLIRNVKVMTCALMNFIMAAVLYSALGGSSVELIPVGVFMAVTLMFLLIGNSLGKAQQNYFYGIRTPWTLESESVWRKTHRFAGKLWVSASLVMIVLEIALAQRLIPLIVLFFVYAIAVALLPVVYSYLLFREEKAQSHPEGA